VNTRPFDPPATNSTKDEHRISSASFTDVKTEPVSEEQPRKSSKGAFTMIEVDRDSDDGDQSVGSDKDKHLKGKKGFTTPAFSSGARFDFDD
jgi:hypothetical protein